MQSNNKNGDTQVNLRLPIALKEKIHSIAKQNNRTLNIELNERLVNSFAQPTEANHSQLIKDLDGLLSYYRQNPRLADISQRLQFALSESNQLRDTKFLNPSIIAFELGLTHASEIEDWFGGRLEPSFEQLMSLAQLLGCSKNWLLFGVGKPYPVALSPSSFDVESLLSFCFEPTSDYEKVMNVHFVRNDNKNGELLIIKQFNANACQVYDTNFHISDVVGDSGREQRAVFVLAMLALSKTKAKMKCFSYLLDNANFLKLTAGDEHPLKTIQKFRHQEWMDDIYNESMYRQTGYWTGWQSLCIDINNDIKTDERLSLEYSKIMSKEHLIINKLKSI